MKQKEDSSRHDRKQKEDDKVVENMTWNPKNPHFPPSLVAEQRNERWEGKWDKPLNPPQGSVQAPWADAWQVG